MKILHVIPSLDPKGGGVFESVKQSQRALKDLGVAVDIVCCDAPQAPWLSGSGVSNVYALGPAAFKYGYTARLLPWLRENAQRYDAVIVNGLWQYPGLAVQRALAGTRTPYFVITHGMLDPWFKKAYPWKHLKKWIYWLWAEFRILRDARAVLFTCEQERALARQSFGLYRVQEAVAPYCLGCPPGNGEACAEKFSQAHPSTRGKRMILFLGRIHPKKGCDLVIEAFSKISGQDERLHLVMAGPDQTGWAARLKVQAEHLGIAQRITWTGMLEGDMKWGAFYASEVFCLPSHQENFGISVAEALACGKPVLISDKVNIWREIEEAGAGFVAEDTAAGTIASFKRWLALDAQGYAAMSERAGKCFEKNFHNEQAAARLLAIIQGGKHDS